MYFLHVRHWAKLYTSVICLVKTSQQTVRTRSWGCWESIPGVRGQDWNSSYLSPRWTPAFCSCKKGHDWSTGGDKCFLFLPCQALWNWTVSAWERGGTFSSVKRAPYGQTLALFSSTPCTNCPALLLPWLPICSVGLGCSASQGSSEGKQGDARGILGTCYMCGFKVVVMVLRTKDEDWERNELAEARGSRFQKQASRDDLE